MKFALEPHSDALAGFVASGLPSDYPDAPPASCAFLTAREGGELLGAVAVLCQGGIARLIGMQMGGLAASLDQAFSALRNLLAERGISRIEFAAETEAMCRFAERRAMKVRAVFYVLEL